MQVSLLSLGKKNLLSEISTVWWTCEIPLTKQLPIVYSNRCFYQYDFQHGLSACCAQSTHIFPWHCACIGYNTLWWSLGLSLYIATSLPCGGVKAALHWVFSCCAKKFSFLLHFLIFLVINLDTWPSGHRKSLCFCSFCLDLPFLYEMRFHFQELLNFREDKNFWSCNPSGETKFLFKQEIEEDERTEFRCYNYYVCH